MVSLPHRRTIGLCALAILTFSPPTSALLAQIAECTPYNARCSYYAKFYSGTVTQVQSLKSEGQTAQVIRDSVTVTIGGGRVSCSGTTSIIRTSSNPPYKYTEQGTISGEGLFRLDTPKGTVSDATYTITIACPKSATQWREEAAGRPTKTGSEPSAPPDLKTSPIEIVEKPASDFTVLQGNETMPHPESDDVNGVTGTLQLAWRLTGRLPVPGGRPTKP